MLHGSKDRSTPLDYLKKYQDALKEQGMPYAIHVYDGLGHNFDIPHWDDATRRSLDFFDRYLKSPVPSSDPLR
jgi:dipeptidyl aminopeptidase/acylaminoacyl peptidase